MVSAPSPPTPLQGTCLADKLKRRTKDPPPDPDGKIQEEISEWKESQCWFPTALGRTTPHSRCRMTTPNGLLLQNLQRLSAELPGAGNDPNLKPSKAALLLRLAGKGTQAARRCFFPDAKPQLWRLPDTQVSISTTPWRSRPPGKHAP